MATLTIPAGLSKKWSDFEHGPTTMTGVSVNTGAKTFDNVPNASSGSAKYWVGGILMPISAFCTTSKLMTVLTGTITSYTGTSLVMNVTAYGPTGNVAGCVNSMYGRFAKQAFSSSSNVVASSGYKTFLTRFGLTLTTNDTIRAVNRGTQTTYMDLTVVTYNSTTGALTCTATASSGSGTVSDWLFVSTGTFTSWIIAPSDNDTITLNAGAAFDFDMNNYSYPSTINELTVGTTTITNSSTTVPRIIKFGTRNGKYNITQNAILQTRGNWISILTGDGGAKSYTFPSQWDAMTMPTYVEVETFAGSGIYERWAVTQSTYYGMNRYGANFGGDLDKVPVGLALVSGGAGTGINALSVSAGTNYGNAIAQLQSTLGVGTITGGSNYTNGVYFNVPLTVASGTAGSGATANIVVSGGATSGAGAVTNVQIVEPGAGYSTSSVLTAAAANIGGTGSGFSFPVSAVMGSVGNATAYYGDVPLVPLMNTGSGATATVVTSATGAISSFTVVSGGTGYMPGTYSSMNITNNVVPGIGMPTTFGVLASAGFTIGNTGSLPTGAITVTTAGAGYNNGAAITLTAVSLNSIGLGSGATATIITSVGGAITSVNFTNGGTGYTPGTYSIPVIPSFFTGILGTITTAGVITFTIPGNGIIPTGVATLSTAGVGYTASQTYTSVPLTNYGVNPAKAHLSVQIGNVYINYISSVGNGFYVNDILSCNPVTIGWISGNTAAGFQATVSSCGHYIGFSYKTTGNNIATLGAITGGSLYNNGFYHNVPLSGGTGRFATADITVSGGVVTTVTLANGGTGYTVSDSLTALQGVFCGKILSLTGLVGGTGYTDGTYNNTPLIGSSGYGATANITVSGGVVTVCTLVAGGTKYNKDVAGISSLYASPNIIGNGTGFSVTINTIQTATTGSGFSIPVATVKNTNGNALVNIQSSTANGNAVFNAFTAGSGYANGGSGTYYNVPLRRSGGSGGNSVVANLTITSGAVSAISVINGGDSNNAGTFTVDNVYLGGTGSGFITSTTRTRAASTVNGVYFAGYAGTPDALSPGDMLTIENGSDVTPVVYVTETGDFSGATPYTNILTATVFSPYNASSPNPGTYYGSWMVYDCVGGSGTGAKFVFTNTSATTANITQAGHFIAGTGYAVGDLITVGQGGLIVRVTEIKNTLTVGVQGKVCTWDHAGRTLRFGDGVYSAAIPNGANVRVPNIVIDALPTEALIVSACTSYTSTLQFESGATLSDLTTSSTSGVLQADYESIGLPSISGGAKSAYAIVTYNTTVTTANVNNRGLVGTFPSTHPAGTIVKTSSGTTSNNQRFQFATSPGGYVDLEITMLGMEVMPVFTGTRYLRLKNVGWAGKLSVSTTTGPVIMDGWSQAGWGMRPSESGWTFTTVQNNLTCKNGVYVQTTGNDGSTALASLLFQQCPYVVEMNNINMITVREMKSDRRHFQINNCQFVDADAYPHDINIIGGQLYMPTQSNFNMYNVKIGGGCNKVLQINGNGGFSTTAYGTTNCINGASCTNLLMYNCGLITDIQPPKGTIISTDAGCSNWLLHDFTGNGSIGGYCVTQNLLSNTGSNVKLANFSIHNLRTPYTLITNNTQTANLVQNVRSASTGLDYLIATAQGNGHGSLDVYDFVAGKYPYWATGGNFTGNLPDASWFYNFCNHVTTPTTGTLVIGCGGLNSSFTQYIITGSSNTYPDNGGRFYIGAAGDSVRFINAKALRGITGFQSIIPTNNLVGNTALFSAITSGPKGLGWYNFNIINAGTNYTATASTTYATATPISYSNVLSGTGAKVTAVVSGNIVTSFAIGSSGGSGFTAGTYNNVQVSFTGMGSPTLLALATVVVTGTAVTGITLVGGSGGLNYSNGTFTDVAVSFTNVATPGIGGKFIMVSVTNPAVTAGYICAGIGYKSGDILTFQTSIGNAGTALIQLTNGYTEEFRMCPWGQDITAVAYSSLTYSNLQTAFAAMSNYNSNIGLQFDLRITADAMSSPYDFAFGQFGAMVFYQIETLLNSSYNPSVDYVSNALTGLSTATNVSIFDNTNTSIASATNVSGAKTLLMPYQFDGNDKTVTVKIRSFLTNWDDYSLTFNKSNVSHASAQTTDIQLTETTVSNVAGWTTLETTTKGYDYTKYYGTLPANHLIPKIATRANSVIDYGSYNLIYDLSASDVFNLSANNITFKAGTITGSDLVQTTGTITFNNGSVANARIQGSNGATGKLTVTAPTGSSIVIYDRNGARVDYVASYSTPLTYWVQSGVTGSYTYKITKYGYIATTGSLVVTGGGLLSIAVASLTADTGITQAIVGTVAAYTTLENIDKVYDYAAYFETTTIGIDFVRLATKVGSLCDIDGHNLNIDSTAVSVYSWNNGTNTATIKATALGDGSTFTSLKTTGLVSYLNGSTFTTIITDSTGTTGILSILSLNGHNVYVEDNSLVQKAYSTNQSGTFILYINSGATGTWRWRVVKYGQIPMTATFTATGGGRFSVTPIQVSDTYVTQGTLATVLAYTALENWDKFYDYCQAYLTTANGKTLGQFAIKSGSAVSIGSYNLILNKAYGSVFNLTGNTITVKDA